MLYLILVRTIVPCPHAKSRGKLAGSMACLSLMFGEFGGHHTQLDIPGT